MFVRLHTQWYYLFLVLVVYYDERTLSCRRTVTEYKYEMMKMGKLPRALKLCKEKMEHKWKECKYKSTSRADAKISISFKLLDLDYTPGQGTARTSPAPKSTETHFD